MTRSDELREMVAEAHALRAFLSGEVPMDGLWFGDVHPKRSTFWWRKSLNRIDAITTELAAALEREAAKDAAMHRFCDRVEAGEVRSEKTYGEFCIILGRPVK